MWNWESLFILNCYMKNITKAWILHLEVWNLYFSIISNCSCVDIENLRLIPSSRFGISKLYSPTRELQYPTTVILQGNFAFHCGGSLFSKQLCNFLLDISRNLSSAKGKQKWGGRQIIVLDINTNSKCSAGILAFRNGHFSYWWWKLLGTLQGITRVDACRTEMVGPVNCVCIAIRKKIYETEVFQFDF